MRTAALFMPVFLWLGWWTLVRVPPEPGGSVSVSPAEGVAGDYGTWTVTWRAGREGMRRGGAMRVQLPDSWHSGERNSANRLQASDPKADHHVSARCSREGVRLETAVEGESEDTLVKSSRAGLDGRSERYVFVARVKILEGELREGDTLSVVYGDTSGGSRGMRASIISTGPEPILTAIDAAGNGDFRLHPDRPVLRARSGPAVELLLHGPATLVAGKPAELRLAVVDAHANPAASFRGEVALRAVTGRADLPGRVTFTGREGWEAARFTPRGSGILRLEATAGQRGVLRARSNPMRVAEREAELKTYWGDLHSHTRFSWDGVGDRAFEYARHVSGLDFLAVTDHSNAPRDEHTRGLGPHAWDEYTALADRHHDPGSFVTLHAYEASFGSPYGHHNVFFRDRPGALLAPDAATLPELWRALVAGEALTIPHHTGKFPSPVLWEPHDPEFRRNFEIYSAHGLSESYDPGHPLAFEQSDFTAPSRSARGAQSAQDAWSAGLILSTIASSDDHRAHPGQPHWGAVAIRASGLTRAEVFDGLYHRRTYGTTGARILLDFRVNGAPMGETVRASAPPKLEIEAHGTDVIDTLEILRSDGAGAGFRVLHRLEPGGADFAWSRVDESWRGDSVYYVRLRQRNPVRGRIVMAWSSPVWVRSN